MSIYLLWAFNKIKQYAESIQIKSTLTKEAPCNIAISARLNNQNFRLNMLSNTWNLKDQIRTPKKPASLKPKIFQEVKISLLIKTTYL